MGKQHKQCSKQVLKELAKVRLLSFVSVRLWQLGEVPEKWKVADVTSAFERIWETTGWSASPRSLRK